jgi:hypothetical protein
MKKIILIAISILLTGVTGYCQNKAEAYKADLDFLKSNLPQKHINLFAKISQSEFEKQISNIESKIDTLPEEEFLNELFQLMVAVGDEHTQINPLNLFSYTLPINFTFFKEGLFVTEATQPDLLLAQLKEINGMPVEKVMEKFKSIIPNYNQSFFQTILLFYINNTYILKGLRVTNSKELVSYTLEKPNGTRIILELKHGNKEKKLQPEQFSTLAAYNGTGNYQYTYYPDKNTLYFNYRNCKEDANYPFEQFNKELFESIATNKPKKLVIDLRYNGGGNSRILAPFLARLKTSELNSTGKLYVLIGKMTFSSALLNALDLKRNYNTILVGEPTAGSINHYGETRAFELPNTKATVVYSTNYFEQWKDHDGPLIPDILVNYSIENFKKGIDEAFEAISHH